MEREKVKYKGWTIVLRKDDDDDSWWRTLITPTGNDPKLDLLNIDNDDVSKLLTKNELITLAKIEINIIKRLKDLSKTDGFKN